MNPLLKYTFDVLKPRLAVTMHSEDNSDLMESASNAIANWNWLLGFLYFGIGFFLHIVVWRYFRSFRKVPILFFIFMLPVMLYFGLSHSGMEILPGLLLHLLLSINYISIYPALQASSPSLVLMEKVWMAKDGLAKSEIINVFAQKNILGERMKDLNSSGLIKNDRNLYTLTRRGNWIAIFFICYRKVLNLPLGAG